MAASDAALRAIGVDHVQVAQGDWQRRPGGCHRQARQQRADDERPSLLSFRRLGCRGQRSRVVRLAVRQGCGE
jgi:hypothetical protein